MFVTTYDDAADFLQAAEPFLAQDEATNGLMLGIALRLRRAPDLVRTPPFLATVQDGGAIALAVLMTPPNNIILAGDPPALSDPFAILARHLLSRNWNIPGVIAPMRLADRFAETWAADTGARCHLTGRLRVYELRQVRPIRHSSGRLRLAAPEDVPLLAAWMHAFQRDLHMPVSETEARDAAEQRVMDGEIYLWDDGVPVSMAAKARPTAHGITVNFVYTPPEHRRRGYATSCVARLSELLLRSGHEFCTLFTDLANPTSNDIYQRIGYTQVADFHQYEFQSSQ